MAVRNLHFQPAALKQMYEVEVFGETILTTVTKKASVVVDWMYDVTYNAPHGRCIGLDVRHFGNPWQPGTVGFTYGKKCLITQIYRMNANRRQIVRQFLLDIHNRFLGVRILPKLNTLSQVVANLGNIPENVQLVDLGEVVSLRYYPVNFLLATQTTIVAWTSSEITLGMNLELPANAQTDWGRHRRLSNAMVQYACTKATASYFIGRWLNIGGAEIDNTTSISPRFRGHCTRIQNTTVFVTVSNLPEAAEIWVHDVRALHQNSIYNLAISLDFQLRADDDDDDEEPSTSSAPLRIHSLQLCAENRCIVYELSEPLPSALQYFFVDPDNTFIGVGIANKLNRLHAEYGIGFHSHYSDVFGLVADHYDLHQQLPETLDELSTLVLGFELERPPVLEDNLAELSDADVRNICIDAYYCLKIFASISE